MTKVITVTGTPGTGKTTISKQIAEQKEYQYIDVNKIISQNNLSEEYDSEKKCQVIDVEKLNKNIVTKINNAKQKSEKGLVIDSHLAHHLPKEFVDLCIVTKCNLKTLKTRLEKRSYGEEKIRENLDCEIFDICLNEAKEAGHKILIVETDKPVEKNIFK